MFRFIELLELFFNFIDDQKFVDTLILNISQLVPKVHEQYVLRKR